MGLLTFALNVTLDGCCDHREMVANDEMLRYWMRGENFKRPRASYPHTLTPVRCCRCGLGQK